MNAATSLSKLNNVLQALSMQDFSFWACSAWAQDPLQSRIDKNRQMQDAQSARQCGFQEAHALRQQYGPLSPCELARQLHLSVGNLDLPLSSGIMVFARLQPPNRIFLQEALLKKVQSVVDENRITPFVGGPDCHDVLLAHELFHAVEHRKTKHIFTKNSCIKLRTGPFTRKAHPQCLSEIGAMAFAQALLTLSYDPCLWNAVLTWYCNPVFFENTYSGFL